MTPQEQMIQSIRTQGMTHGPRREPESRQDIMDTLAIGSSFIPVVGDVAGLAADANMYATDPESRTWLNYMLTALGMVPGIPAASALKKLRNPSEVVADRKGLMTPARPGSIEMQVAGPGAMEAPRMGTKNYDAFDNFGEELIEAKAGSPSKPKPGVVVSKKGAIDPGTRWDKHDTQGLIPSRWPTAEGITLDKYDSVRMEDMKPEQIKTQMKLASKYPQSKFRVNTPADRAAEEFIELGKENLLSIYNNVPESVRTSGSEWYDGAHQLSREMADKYGFGNSPEAAAGVIAALSPQKDWYQNVSLADRVMDIYSGQKDPFTREMMDTFVGLEAYQKADHATQGVIQNLLGKGIQELDSTYEKALWTRLYDETYNIRDYDIIHPSGDVIETAMTQKGDPAKVAWGSLKEVTKAIEAMEIPTIDHISQNLGKDHKVRSFFNNINRPMATTGDVTMDTHAVAAAQLRPLAGGSTELTHNFGGQGVKNNTLTGVKGMYPIYAEMYRQAADEIGILPRQLQSVTWEGVRGLFEGPKKSQLKPIVDELWTEFRKGRLSADDARESIVNISGGFSEPTWNQ